MATCAVLALSTPTVCSAVTRSCGPDPVANTADVLCAPPSGPCDATTVLVSKSIRVPDSGCRFDLGGRALVVQRTIETAGGQVGGSDHGGILVDDATGVTIAKRGRLRSRGRPGTRPEGGYIVMDVAGEIVVQGTIDTSGAFGGYVSLTADGDVTLAPTAKLRLNGVGGFVDLGQRYADGGGLGVTSRGGSIWYAPSARLRGSTGGAGGYVDLGAARGIEIVGHTDVTGGSNDGGNLWASAQDDILVKFFRLDGQSRQGGAMGASVDLEAGIPVLGVQDEDAHRGGFLVIHDATFDLRGSANDNTGPGSGGWFDALAAGRLEIDESVIIRADGAGSPEAPDGDGGLLSFSSERVPAADPGGFDERSDVVVAGVVSARGGKREGFGGEIDFYVDRDLYLDGSLAVGGRGASGAILADAGRNIVVSGPIAAAAQSADGDGGLVGLVAGVTEVGRLAIDADVDAAGGARSAAGSHVELSGCPITVAPDVTVDASRSVGTGGVPGASSLALFSGQPVVVGAGARLLAGADGVVSATHPATIAPVIGAGVVVDPAPLVEATLPAEAFATCPWCSNDTSAQCGPRVRVDAVATTPDAIDATAIVESPSGRPLAGTVEVCDGSGVEDVTFTWLAASCGERDALELTINDTVVADLTGVVPESCDQCPNPGQIDTYTVPLAEAAALLIAGPNRFGIRKSDGRHTKLAWAYVSVTANGAAERIPLFDRRLVFDHAGASSFDDPNFCSGGYVTAAVDAASSSTLCAPVASVAWTDALPCGVDLAPLVTDRDYTLVIGASDGISARATAAAAFTRGSQPVLTLNGATCGGS